MSLIGAACVAGLVGTAGLPAFASDLTESAPPPVMHTADEQRFAAQPGFGSRQVSLDRWLSAAAPSWVAPVKGELRDGYGPRLVRPVAGVSGMHRGQDLGASCGASVRAASAGVVVQAGWFGTYGNWVLIDHGGGVMTGYAHNSVLRVQVGQQIDTGQVVALAGTTGASSGCHVHLEVRAGSAAVEPVGFLQQRGVQLG